MRQATRSQIGRRTKVLLHLVVIVVFVIAASGLSGASGKPPARGATLVSLNTKTCGGKSTSLALLEYASLLRPLATNAAIDFRINGLSPLITLGSCTCGYVDGRFTAPVTIPFSNNSTTEQQAWNPVLADYDNVSCDGANGVSDADAYIQSTGRDLQGFAVTWDSNFYYGYTMRVGSDTNKDVFFYYADTNNDGKMSTGEPVLVVTWQGSNQSVSIQRYSYNAANSGGDTLVYTGQPIVVNNGHTHTIGSADGYTMPGTISYAGGISPDADGFGFATGDRMEWRVRWIDLGLSGPRAIRWHISSSNSTNVPQQIDDNMGGCGACAGSTQYSGVNITGTASPTAAPGAIVYLAHTIQNTGNANDVFELSGSYSGPWAPISYQFYKDVNGNGVYDAGDTLLTDSDADGTPDTGSLAPNATINIIVAVTIPSTASGTSTITTTATSNFQQCNYPKTFATVNDSVTAKGTATLSGYVYLDANHNGTRETSGENGLSGVSTQLYVKLAPTSGNATQFATVDPTTGAFSFSLPAAGTYRLIVDDNSSLTDTLPWTAANWTPTENASGIITVTVGLTSITGQNFGFYNGTKVTGVVFSDDGSGSGATANNGTQEGSEASLAGVTITATNGGTTSYGTATTDSSGAYTLWIPAGATVVVITETVPSGRVAIKATTGNTNGSATTEYKVTFNDTGVIYSGVNFAVVPTDTFAANSQASGNPGAYVLYTHTLQSGSGGAVILNASSTVSPAFTGFTEAIYRDANCNGVLDAGEDVDISGQSIPVTANANVCIIVRDNIPANVPIGTQNTITLSARHNYTPSAVYASRTVTDTTTVTGTALTLAKAVDKANAAPGDDIIYTINFTNNSTGALTNLLVVDSVPMYTVFKSAACTQVPASLACATSVNSSGQVQWSMSGSLAAGAGGTLSFTVNVQN